MSKERESAWGAAEGARRATGGAPEERRDGRGRWSAKRKYATRARTGCDRGDTVRLAGSVPGWRCGKPESAGSRCEQRRDAAAEIAGRRSEHEQRTVVGKDPPPGGGRPLGLAEAEAMSRAAYWNYWTPSGEKACELNPENPRYRAAIWLWKRLPLTITRLFGPPITRCLP